MFWSWAGWPGDKPLDSTGLIGLELEVRANVRGDEGMIRHYLQFINVAAGDKVQRVDFQPDPILLLSRLFIHGWGPGVA
jgi:hypothetical protein